MPRLIQIELPAALGPAQSGQTGFHVLTKPVGAICNLDCKYCYYLEKEKLYGSKEKFRMNDDLLESYIRHFIDSQPGTNIEMAWQGGEPTLLGIDFFRRVVELQKRHAGNKVIRNAIQTNGTLLNDEWGSFLKENDFLVGVSIDGPAHLHDKYRVDKQQRPTFNLVVAGIDVLKRYGVDFNTLTTVNRGNQDHPLEVYHFLKELGSQFMQFIPLVERKPDNGAKALGLDLGLPPGEYNENSTPVTHWSVEPKPYGTFLTTIFDEWVRQDVGKIFVQIFDVALAQVVDGNPGLCIFAETCGTQLVMEHNGDVFSCDHYVYPQYRLGNIATDTFPQMLNSPAQRKFGEDKRSTLPQYCVKCEVRFACNGDCPKHRFTLTPDGEEGLSYLCASYKHFFNHAMPYVLTMAQLISNQQAPARIMQLIAAREAAELRRRTEARWKTAGRNDACPCGSGQKYKKCCLGKEPITDAAASEATHALRPAPDRR